MSDDLIGIRFILVLLYEVRCTGKSDLVDVFFNFIEGHSKSVIDEL